MRILKIVGSLVVLVICAGIAMAFVDPGSASQARKIGEDVRGHWFAEREGGCFSDSSVFTIYDEQITGMWEGEEHLYNRNVEFDIADGIVIKRALGPNVLEGRDIEWVNYELKYADQGDRLVAVSGTMEGRPVEPLHTTLIQCGNYSWWGRVSLLWRSPFNPD